jgi:hypothetical protein
MKNLDAKLLVLVSATLIAGLFAGRSILSAGETAGDRGFDGSVPLPLGGQIDDTPALVFQAPAVARNPFADGRDSAIFGEGVGAGDLSDGDESTDPTGDTSFEG